MTQMNQDIDQKSINICKALILDTVRKANSGHSGGPLSAIDFTYVLYKDFLKIDPDDPNWFNRDRFVMSAGHLSALQYAMLSLVGWLNIDDLKKFRQLHSKTPGHPEKGEVPGVDATTGPLGQGVGNAVGMAVAECILSKQFGDDLINHYTYLLHGDGDIQEPVAQGAIALAGHWGLGKLIAFYDANNAQISGKVSRSDSTDYVKFFESNHWHVQEINGHDRDAIRDAIRISQMEIDKPSIIIGKTIMANGTASMENDHNTHGMPLTEDEIKLTKIKLGLDPNKTFHLPKEVTLDFRSSFEYARKEVLAWKKLLEKKQNNKLFDLEWNSMVHLSLPEIDWPKYENGTSIATRKVWGDVIEKLCIKMPSLVGGSADLEPSNNTGGFAKIVGDFGKDNFSGRNFAYGVREFPMGTINNGISQHGGLLAFGATFFTFSDYERPAIRLRALQGLPVITEYTHDSIHVGEDGPTHQPIEHLMAARTIPNLLVLRPADANEAVVACKIAMEQKDRPSLVVLSRQNLPVLDRNTYAKETNFRKGGYVISNSENPDVVIFASGSEISLSLDIKEKLKDYSVKVINMGCWELFEEQSQHYKDNVLNSGEALLVSIEAGITNGWQKYTGRYGLNFGIDTYGASAPGEQVARYLKLTVEDIARKIKQNLK